MFHEPHTTYAPNFFIRNDTLYLPYFGSLPFLILELEFFENEKFKCLQRNTCDVLGRQLMLHECNLCCSTQGVEGVLSRWNTLHYTSFDYLSIGLKLNNFCISFSSIPFITNIGMIKFGPFVIPPLHSHSYILVEMKVNSRASG